MLRRVGRRVAAGVWASGLAVVWTFLLVNQTGVLAAAQNNSGFLLLGVSHPIGDDSPLEFYLDQYFWKTATNGSGPVEVNRSNGTAIPDGHELLIAGGTTFTHGFGVFAPGKICFALSAASTRFKSTVGVDDQITSGGSVRFVLESPSGSEIYRSAALTSASANVSIDQPLSSPSELCLSIETNGDGATNDMGVWGNARVLGAAPLAPCDFPGVVNVTAGSSQATMTAAITTAGTNGFMCWGAGVHRITAALTPLAGQTWGGRGATSTQFIGSRLLTSWTQSGSNWFATGQTQAGATNFYGASSPDRPEDHCGNATDMGLAASPRCANPEDTFLDGVRLNHVASLATCTASGQWFLDYTADRVYVCGQDPNGHTVETTVVDQLTTGSADNVRLLSMGWKWFASPLLRYTVYGGSSWRIEDIDCAWVHGACGNVLPGWIFRNSTLHDNGEYGTGGDGGSGLFEGNVVYGNGWSGLSEYWGVGGSKFAGKDGLTIRNNFSHHNRGPGFWSDTQEGVNTVYEDNILEANARAGIMHEYSGSAIIRNNTARGNGTRITFDGGGTAANWLQNGCVEWLDSVNGDIYGNLCIDNIGGGITVLEDARGHDVSNITVHDNVTVYTTNPSTGFGRTGFGDLTGTEALAQITYTSNTYCLPTGSQTYFQTQASGGTTALSDASWNALSQTTTETIVRLADCSAYTAGAPGGGGGPDAGTCPADAVPTLQQAAVSASANNQASVTVTLGTAPQTGCVMIACHMSVDINSIGPAGWTEAVAVTNTTENDQMAMYYRVVQSGDAASWTFTHGGGNSAVTIREFSGLDTAALIDQTASTARTPTATSLAAGSVTTALSEAVAVACIGIKSTVTSPSWNSSYTNATQAASSAGATDATLLTATRVLSSTGTYNPVASWTTAVTAMGVQATFKGAP